MVKQSAAPAAGHGDQTGEMGEIERPPALFPVSGSLLSARALLTTVLPAYDIGTPTACTLWSSGVNDVYRVPTAGGEYFLKVYRAGWRSRAEVLFELDVVAHLARRGVAVARPLATRAGVVVHELLAPEGTRQAVLYGRAPGRPFTWPFYRDAAESGLLGGALAAIHNASDDFVSAHPRPQLDLDLLLEQPLAVIRPFLADRPEDWAYLLALAARLRAYLTHPDARALDWGLCHGDFHSGNAFIADGHSVAVFDFDACGLGWRAGDLARVHRPMTEQDETIWAAFLEGYTDRRPLHRRELAAILAFVPLGVYREMGLKLGGVARNWWDSEWVHHGYVGGEIASLRAWDAAHLAGRTLPPGV